MSLRKQVLRGSFMLTVGQGVVYASSFVRNMILARLLTKADFGIAAAFSMVVLLLEFSARLGISRFVIRDKEGDDPEFIASAHLVQFLASFLSTIVMVLATYPLAHLFKLGEHRAAMLALALIPLIRGFQHVDVRRYERGLRFGPSTLVEVIPQVIITLAAYPLAKWLTDYRVMLILLIAKEALGCVVAQWQAENPYRWRFHKEYVTRMLRFGWPLVVTGFLMFGVLHGDQFLIATFYTMSDLGPYAAAFSLTMAPSYLFGRIFNSIMLPLLSKVQDEPEKFRKRYRQSLAMVCAFSAVCAVGTIVGAEPIMRLVYGPKYAGTGLILSCLAMANAFRNVRIAPSLAAMARGDSTNQMVSNLWRVIALAPALGIALMHKPVWMIALFGVFGELLAWQVALTRLRNRDGIPISLSVGPTLMVAMTAGFSFAASRLGVNNLSPIAGFGVAAFFAFLVGILMVCGMPELRAEASKFLVRWSELGFHGFWVKLRNKAA